jgi:hypothetical protein
MQYLYLKGKKPSADQNLISRIFMRYGLILWFGFMVLNATFNNISVISWQLVQLAEETGITVENHRPSASHWQNLSHNVVSSFEIWNDELFDHL